MRACVHACMRACVHACMRACVHACMRACVHACVSVCICAYLHAVNIWLALVICFGKGPVLIRNTFNSEVMYLLFGDSIVVFNSFLFSNDNWA